MDQGTRFSGVNQQLLERTIHDIRHGFDPNYSARMGSLAKLLGFSGWFFNDLRVSGVESIPLDKQIVYLGNHLSHSDYLVAWNALSENNVPLPRFCAGKNLDHPLFLGLFGMDFRRHGTFFVDRDLLSRGRREEREAYALAFDHVVHEMLHNGEGLFVFPEGGRQYQGTPAPAEKVKSTIFRVLAHSAESWPDLAVVPVAFAYNTRIEEDAFSTLTRTKSRSNLFERMQYYGADLGSFFKRFADLRAHDGSTYSCAVSFGEPIDLQQALARNGDSPSWKHLRSEVWERVHSLHEQIKF